MRSVVVVAFGGKSTEHDVSVITGVLALNALKSTGEKVLPLYVDKEGCWCTGDWMWDVKAFAIPKKWKTKRVVLFPGSDTLYEKRGKKIRELASVRSALVCLHGKNGEDGQFSALMSASNVPVSCPQMTESALLMDKWLSKSVLADMQIPVLTGISVLNKDFIENPLQVCESLKEKLSFPLCVKPARLGSSIGISVCRNEEELAQGLSTVFRYDFRALVEPALTNFTEYSVGVYQKDGEVLCGVPLRQTHQGEILSFGEKYGETGAYVGENKCVNDVKNNEEALLTKISEYAKRAYQSLRLCGVVRVDFLCAERGIFLNEINTVPGSLSYYYFAKNTKKAGFFFNELLKEGVTRFREDNALITSFDSNVLSGIKGIKQGKKR